MAKTPTVPNSSVLDIVPSSVVDRVLVLGLCCLLIFGVMAFGAVEAWSIFAFEVGTTVLGLAWAGKQVFSGQPRPTKSPLYLPALIFLVVVIGQVVLARSAYPYVTKYAALQYVSYGIVLLIASDCFRDKESRRTFVLIMTAFGASYALFALLQDLTSNSKLFWIRAPRFPSSIYGSYVNRNHYAGLMEMLVPIPLALSMGQLLPGVKRLVVGFGSILMASTIFLSGSRGGMISFLLELVLLALLTFGKKRRIRAVLGFGALCISTLLLVFFSSNGRQIARIGDMNPGIRPQIVKDSLRMFGKHPLFGWGLATFPTVYPRYRSFYTDMFVNEAHNDYLQLLAETGVVGFALMLWFLIGLYGHGFASLRDWQHHWDRTLSVAALVGCTGILLHSFFDFNLQIPANAAFFYTLCALASTDLPLSPLKRLSSDTNTGIHSNWLADNDLINSSRSL